MRSALSSNIGDSICCIWEFIIKLVILVIFKSKNIIKGQLERLHRRNEGIHILENLMNSPYAWGGLSIIAIVSFVYAIVCQQKNKERKEITYSKNSKYLIREKKRKYEKLNITYDNQEIGSLCVSRITVWNSGNRVINQGDIVETKELAVRSLRDGEILDVEIVASTEVTNKFSIVQVDSHTVRIDFSYVEVKSGVVVQIMHTGSPEDLVISCKIKGGSPLKEYKKDQNIARVLRKSVDDPDFQTAMFIAIAVALCLVFTIAIICTIAIFDEGMRSILNSETWPFPEGTVNLERKITVGVALMIWLALGIGTPYYFSIFRAHFKIGVPRELKQYSGFES